MIGRICLILSLMFVCETIAFAGCPEPLLLPSPKHYKHPKEIWGRQYKSLKTALGPWTVLASSMDIKLYASEDMQKERRKAGYLEKFYVFDSVVSQDEAGGRTMHCLKLATRRNECHDFYWAEISQLIILPQVTRDPESGLPHKGVLINIYNNEDRDEKDILKNLAKNAGPIQPKQAPRANAANSHPPLRHQKFVHFFYIYAYYPSEEDPQYILIGKDNNIVGYESQRTLHRGIIGWVPSKRVHPWLTREGFELNPQRKHPAYFFKDRDLLARYYQDRYKGPNSSPPDLQHLMIHNDWVTNRKAQICRADWPANEPRYLIKQKCTEKDDYMVLYVLDAELDPLQKIKKMMDKLKNIDIVFLFDATNSMKNYLKEVKKIPPLLIDLLEKEKWIKGLRVGAAVYRDFNDGDNMAYDPCNLKKIKKSDKKPEFMKFLVESAEPYSKETIVPNRARSEQLNHVNPEEYHTESVFQALIKVTNLSWGDGHTKLLVHIGDCGDHPSQGKKNYSEEEIAKQFVKKGIHYVALQVVPQTYKGKLFEKDAGDDLHKNALVKFHDQAKKIIQDGKNEWKTKFVEHELIGTDAQRKGKKKQAFNSHFESDKEWIWTHSFLYEPTQMTKDIKNTIDTIVSRLGFQIDFIEVFLVGSFQPEISSSAPWHSQMACESRVLLKQACGEEQYKKLIDNIAKGDCEFYKRAYVKMKINQSPDQFVKSVLFLKKEYGDIVNSFQILNDETNFVYAESNTLANIWIKMIEAISGEKISLFGTREPNISLAQIFKRQFGVSLINQHPLLKISLSKIMAGSFKPRELGLFLIQLRDCYNIMKQVNADNKRWFTPLDGEKMGWIKAQGEMP